MGLQGHSQGGGSGDSADPPPTKNPAYTPGLLIMVIPHNLREYANTLNFIQNLHDVSLNDSASVLDSTFSPVLPQISRSSITTLQHPKGSRDKWAIVLSGYLADVGNNPEDISLGLSCSCSLNVR